MGLVKASALPDDPLELQRDLNYLFSLTHSLPTLLHRTEATVIRSWFETLRTWIWVTTPVRRPTTWARIVDRWRWVAFRLFVILIRWVRVIEAALSLADVEVLLTKNWKQKSTENGERQSRPLQHHLECAESLAHQGVSLVLSQADGQVVHVDAPGPDPSRQVLRERSRRHTASLLATVLHEHVRPVGECRDSREFPGILPVAAVNLQSQRVSLQQPRQYASPHALLN